MDQQVALIPAHHPLGPSASDRWLNCTASVRMTLHLPDTTSVFAAEGSVAHELAELLRDDPEADYVGSVMQHDGFNIEVTQEMVDYVLEFMAFCDNLPGDRLTEEKIQLHPYIENGFGRADDIRIDEATKTMYVTDFKYGKGVPVYAEGNTQAMLYGLGAFITFGFLYGIDHTWTVINSIHQPRINNINSSEPVTVKDLLYWADTEVAPKAQEALNMDGPANFAAGSWCKWCKISATCEFRAKALIEEHLSDFEILTDEAGTPPDPTTLTPAQIGRIMDALPDIKAWIKNVEQHALSEMAHSRPPMGADGPYKLVAGRGGRDWSLTEAETVEALSDYVDDAAELYTRKLLTPPAVEKLLGKKVFKDIEAALVLKKQGKPTMVPASDKRQEVSFENDFLEADEFEVLE